MKKQVLLALFATLGLSAFAQSPILDDTDVGAVGSIYYMATDTNIAASVNEGPSGAAQNWDFSTLGWQTVDTVRFVSPASTSHAADFPTANLAFQTSAVGGGHIFLENNSTRLEAIGMAGDPFGVGMSIVVHFDPTQTLAEFPMTYGDSFLDTTGIYYADTTSLIAGVDSVRYTSTIYRSVSVDAWGTLVLGGGTYNTIRMFTIEHAIDMIEAHTLFGWIPFSNSDVTDTSYGWWGETRGYLLCQVNISDGSVSSIDYLDPNSVGVDEPTVVDYHVSIFPNPTSGTITVLAEDSKAATVELMDVKGTLVRTVQLTGLRSETDLGDLAGGLYIYRVRDAKGFTLTSGKITLSH